jgi:hypothetical protein
MRNWGGPGINRQPGPECRSCFKDGISFSEDPPRGFQTPVFNLDNSRTTFNDAALTFLDRTITGVDGRNAIVVLFRCEASCVTINTQDVRISSRQASSFIILPCFYYEQPNTQQKAAPQLPRLSSKPASADDVVYMCALVSCQ